MKYCNFKANLSSSVVLFDTVRSHFKVDSSNNYQDKGLRYIKNVQKHLTSIEEECIQARSSP
ncbi:uncharacterized protein PHALS_14512 [Plasmopara halstedii]|uniref:Uncharacterized protein n=1 Tax=Plasmopara halstedii TaxID=4781 RepID=A0A0N7L5E0_PLAHL|nr:uncharacterized protein PHALS_14512 [Plasmopara halstedii]CEG41211.1 hypothetical protein PHALS_14512 [Plasmopara halstedii]|eukprot:XP_024577580.1 hypothetical protein PHALS_14512 [Plasmopara halstedii]